jgi:tripartite-type tricarboxylate transporter receptor subunit TctC
MFRYVAMVVAAGVLAIGPVRAEQDAAANYPNRPVRIIVDVAPGGGVDTATRLVAAKLEQSLGQPFVVENRPGAAGNIGAEVVFTAEPDGYTLLASSPSPLAINQWLYKKLSYDPAGFQPIAMMSRIPNVLVVRQDFPASTVQEAIAYLKANPGKISFGSQGVGTASHLTGVMLMKLIGSTMVHVPYKGTAPILTDIIAGHIDLTFIQVSSAYVMHEAGKARILALATDKRLDFLPDVPTLAEIGLPISTDTWNAISAPPKTPTAIVAKLNAAVNTALRQPDVRQRLRDLKTVIGGDGGPAEAAKFVEAERRQWGELVQAAGLVPQ